MSATTAHAKPGIWGTHGGSPPLLEPCHQEVLTTVVTSAQVKDGLPSESSTSASSTEDKKVGIRRFWKYSFRCRKTSPIKVSSLWVVGPKEVEPVSLLWTGPGRAPWVKALATRPSHTSPNPRPGTRVRPRLRHTGRHQGHSYGVFHYSSWIALWLSRHPGPVWRLGRPL